MTNEDAWAFFGAAPGKRSASSIRYGYAGAFCLHAANTECISAGQNRASHNYIGQADIMLPANV